MAKLHLGSVLKLNTGYDMPIMGFGVYQTPADITEECVGYAIELGVRQIDSAPIYENEVPCGVAIRKCGVPREEIFLSTKVWPYRMNYEAAKKDIETSLEDTGLGYIDLYLVHAPYGGTEARRGAWRALVEAQNAGKVRSVGVSNYGIHHLEETLGFIAELEREFGPGKGGKISVGQWEMHPWIARPDLVKWCKYRDIKIQAYSPLARGQRMKEPVLVKLAEKHKATPAQILVRWCLQMGFIPLPKSVSKNRIKENADIYRFELSSEDMEELDQKGVYSPAATWDPTTSTLED